MEFVTILTTMYALLKGLGLNTVLVLSTMVCALVMLLFNLIVIWRLTKPVRDVSNSLNGLTETLKSYMEKSDKRMSEGDERFRSHEIRLSKTEKEISELKKLTAQ